MSNLNNEKNQDCPICFSDIFEDEFKTNCGHTFHGECFNEYLTQFKLDICCPICKKENPITYNLTIQILNSNIIKKENQEIYYTWNEILDIANEHDDRLKTGKNRLVIQSIIINKFTKKIYPLCFNSILNIHAMIINSTIQNRINLLTHINAIDHISFEKFRTSKFYDIDLCPQKLFKIPGYEEFVTKSYVKENIYKVWIIRETGEAYWIQFEKPFLIGVLTRCGPTESRRYYYIKKTGEITILCSEQQILEISPIKEPQLNSYCYSRLLVEYDGYEFVVKKKSL